MMKLLNALMITVKRMALHEQKPFAMGYTCFWSKKNKSFALPTKRQAKPLFHQTKEV